MNGWPVDSTSDKYVLRAESLLVCDLDIIGIAETHLRDDTCPALDGYSVFVHNRTQLHRRAKCGSGGVCLFIKKSVIKSYNVSLLDNTVEDILWVQLVHKVTSLCVSICVCYLPPEGSSRYIDPHEFFTQLMS